MNKLEIIKSKLKCLEMAKAQEEIRGKEFTKVYTAFVNLFAGLFKDQTSLFINYIDTHSILFTPEGGMIIEKSLDEFGDMMPDDEFMGKLGEYLVKANLFGQEGTNKDVTGQVDVLMEVKNVTAELYAKNRAGELMRAVNETTKTEVRDLFSKAFTDNWSVSEIKTAIEEQFTQFSKYRASLIATMETANAYEIGKKDQFHSYQERYGLEGFKRSQTQHDSNVRYTHSLNEIDGWIPERSLFTGTQTDHAPHEFNCRCVTTRRLMEPEILDTVSTQFEKDSSAYISDKQKVEITKAVQKFRQKAPYMPKIGALTDYGDAQEVSAIARFRGADNTLIINNIGWDDITMDPDWGVAGSVSGVARKEAIIYHELGHWLDTYIDTQSFIAEEKFRGKEWRDIADQVMKAKVGLISKWQSGEIPSVKYPLATLEDKGWERGMRELFAESVSGYIIGKTDILDEEMTAILDFLFLK